VGFAHLTALGDRAPCLPTSPELVGFAHLGRLRYVTMLPWARLHPRLVGFAHIG
jgi:hypothetical protein